MSSTPEPSAAGMAEASVVPDAVLRAALPVSRAALLEVTEPSTIGEPAGSKSEGDRVFSLYFECLLAGYPGWYWSVILSHSDDEAQPSVLETGLFPGGGALVAPPWIPWSDHGVGDGEWPDSADESSDGDGVDTDADESADDGSRVGLHAGDIDGIDIDDLDGARG